MGREKNDGPSSERAPNWAIRAIRAQGTSSLTGGLLTVAVVLAAAWLISYVLGGADRMPPHWFYIPILLAAARFGLPGAAAAAVAAGLLAGPLLPADVATREAQPLADWLGRLGFFVGIGLVMGAVTAGLTAALRREIGHARDATELAVLEGEERTRAILETANEAVVGMDGAGAITDWNRAAEQTFGWPREEAIGRVLADTLMPERYRERHRTGVARYLATGEGPILNTRVELEALHRDGHEFPIELTVSALQTDGSTTFIAFVHDITERRKAEEALRSSEASQRGLLEAKYRALVEKLPAIVYEAEFGEQGAWRYVSPQIEGMLGFSPERWMGDPELWWERLHPDDRARAIEDEARSRRTGEALRSEYRMIGQDGHVVWFRDEATVLRDDDDRPLLLQGVMFDVSEQKRAEEELRLVNEELEQRVLDRTSQLDAANQELVERQQRLSEARLEAERANGAKSEFLSRMSHELRTPLNAILGFGQLLDMEELTDHQQEAVRQILKGGNHLLSLINEVLDIARIEVGRIHLSMEPVGVNELVGDAIGLVRPLANQQGVTIEMDLADGDPFVVADRQRLRQVLLNLLSNAVKYNREGGSVRCSACSVEPERLRIAVSDDGMGMSTEELQRLFIPFERLGGERTGVEGTGLGLALSKQLTDAMNGTLGVESEPGRGSTFTVELPLGVRPDGSWTVEERLARPTTRTVLCIDDNPANLMVIEGLIGYRPEIRLLSALHGSLGIDLARTHHPDAILLDIGLPDVSGHEIVRRLRADPSTEGIPVIVVSAEASEGAVSSLLAAGAYAHLTKPIDVRRLQQLLDEVLFGDDRQGSVTGAAGATAAERLGGEP